MTDYARRNAWAKRPKITEERMSEASQEFKGAVQRLDKQIVEEPILGAQ